MICDEDPLRRRSRESDGKEKATREVRLDAGKYGQMGFRKQENREIRSSGGGGNDSIPSTVAR